MRPAIRRYASLSIPWCAERVQHAVPQLARARVDERVGHVDGRGRSTAASSAASRNSPSMRRSAFSRSRVAMSSRSSSSVSKPASSARSSSTLGELLRLDLLDGHRELGVVAREVLGAVVLGERDLRRSRRRRRSTPLSWSSKPGMSRPAPSSIIWSRPSPPANGLAVDGADVVDGQEVALLGRALDDVEAREPVAQRLDLAVDRLVVGLRLVAADLEVACTAPSCALGRTPTSIENVSGSPRAGMSPTSSDGSPTGAMPAASTASTYHCGQEPADGLVEHGLAADALDDDGRGDLALAEARGCGGRARAPWRRGRASARLRRTAPRPRPARGTREAR